MTLSQKTCLSVITNNFGGKWVAQMRAVARRRQAHLYTPTTLNRNRVWRYDSIHPLPPAGGRQRGPGDDVTCLVRGLDSRFYHRRPAALAASGALDRQSHHLDSTYRAPLLPSRPRAAHRRRADVADGGRSDLAPLLERTETGGKSPSLARLGR